MPSGGARTRSGPPPDPKALRRPDGDADWLTLPFGGRDGDAPEWPLTEQTVREDELWAKLWAKPQAVAWEKLGLEYEVGLLVRRMAEAETPGSHTSTGTLVRQMMDSLGLTTPGLRSNRWKLSEGPRTTDEDVESAPGVVDARDRFRVA